MLGRDNHHSDISQQQRRLWVRLAARYDTPVRAARASALHVENKSHGQ